MWAQLSHFVAIKKNLWQILMQIDYLFMKVHHNLAILTHCEKVYIERHNMVSISVVEWVLASVYQPAIPVFEYSMDFHFHEER